MGMQLPSELRFALEVLGMEWPATDESLVEAWADDWRRLAGGCGEHAVDLQYAVAGLLERNEGDGISAFVSHINTADSVLSRLSEFSSGCLTIATACEAMAAIVLALKTTVIGHLITLAAAIFAAITTGGLAAGAIIAAKIVAKEAISWAIGEAVSKLLLE